MFYLMLESAFPPKNSPVLLSIGQMLYMKSLTKGLKMIKKQIIGWIKSKKMEAIAMKPKKLLRVLYKACKLALLILLILGHTNAW